LKFPNGVTHWPEGSELLGTLFNLFKAKVEHSEGSYQHFKIAGGIHQ